MNGISVYYLVVGTGAANLAALFLQSQALLLGASVFFLASLQIYRFIKE
jgi:hypothetical protein